jgi:phytoene desaturase
LARKSKKRIVIVGAGPGGLASALMLANTDAEVTVIERKTVPGGRSAPMDIDGYRFDTGATFFLYPRILSEIFAAAGHSLEKEVDLIRLDPQYEICFETGERILATGNLDRMMKEIARFSAHDAVALPKFMTENSRKLDAFKPILEKPFHSLLDLLDPQVLKALRYLRPWKSIDGDLTRYFCDARTRLAFSFQSKYLGMSPFRCPSLFTILSFLEYEHGVFHPRGGCGAVMETMARLAVEGGVDLRLGEDVNRLHFKDRTVIGVETMSGFYPADAVVINADFSRAMQRLVPNRLRRRWSDDKLKSKRYSCSTYMLYLGIEGKLDGLQHHTVLLSEDYKRNISEIESGEVLTQKPSFYVQNACVSDPGLAPKNHSTLYMLVPVPHNGSAIAWDEARKAAYRRVALQRLEAIGITDIERRIRVERSQTPAGWEHDHQIYKGATFNLAHSLDQMLIFRPKNRFDELGGVYLVGGGTHPGSGLPVIFQSARITSRLVQEDLDLETDSSWRAHADTSAVDFAAA